MHGPYDIILAIIGDSSKGAEILGLEVTYLVLFVLAVCNYVIRKASTKRMKRDSERDCCLRLSRRVREGVLRALLAVSTSLVVEKSIFTQYTLCLLFVRLVAFFADHALGRACDTPKAFLALEALNSTAAFSSLNLDLLDSNSSF